MESEEVLDRLMVMSADDVCEVVELVTKLMLLILRIRQRAAMASLNRNGGGRDNI